MTPEQNYALIEKLKARSMHVLIISRHNTDKRHLTDCRFNHAKTIFNNWAMLDKQENEKHWSVIIKNPDLTEYGTTNLFNIQPFTRSKRFLPAFRDYIDIVLSRRRFNLSNTDYWRYATWRGWKNREHHLRRLRRMILLAERDGLNEPMEIRPNGLMIDGNHRLIIAERLGFKRVICKVQSST